MAHVCALNDIVEKESTLEWRKHVIFLDESRAQVNLGCEGGDDEDSRSGAGNHMTHSIKARRCISASWRTSSTSSTRRGAAAHE